jgi:hypothetical protein
MKPSWGDRYIAVHVKVMTFGVHCLTVLAFLSGIVGVFSFAVSQGQAVGDLIFGIVCLAFGVALLRAKRLEAKDLSWF